MTNPHAVPPTPLVGHKPDCRCRPCLTARLGHRQKLNITLPAALIAAAKARAEARQTSVSMMIQILLAEELEVPRD